MRPGAGWSARAVGRRRPGAPGWISARPSGPAPCALRSPLVRAVWIVVIALIVVGLGTWSTTCTGPRPRPTGETIAPGEVATTTVAPSTASTLPPAGG